MIDRLSIKAIDVHVHFPNGPSWSADNLLAEMDAAGVALVVASPGDQYGSDFHEANGVLADLKVASGGRVVGWARINPHFARRAVDDFTYWVTERHLTGLTLHPVAEVFCANDRDLVFPLVDAAERLRVPVMFHLAPSDLAAPALVADVARSFPTIPIVLAHAGMLCHFQSALALCRRVPNLYFETSLSGSSYVTPRAVTALGAERVLFGSGAPISSMGFALERISRWSGLDASQLELVLRGTAVRVAGLAPFLGQVAPEPSE